MISDNKINFIVNLVCDSFRIKRELVFQKNRKQKIVLARYMIMFFLYNFLKLSKVSVGSIFKMDHSSVIHGINQHNNLIDTKHDLYISVYTKVASLVYPLEKKDGYKICQTCFGAERVRCEDCMGERIIYT